MTTNTEPRQLSLLTHDDVPARFRLSASTVRRGRRHIAEIRQMLRARPDESLDAPSQLPHRGHAA